MIKFIGLLKKIQQIEIENQMLLHENEMLKNQIEHEKKIATQWQNWWSYDGRKQQEEE